MSFKELQKKLEDLEQEKFTKQLEMDDLETDIEDTMKEMQVAFHKEKNNEHKNLINDALNNLKNLWDNMANFEIIKENCENCPYYDECEYLDESELSTSCNLIQLMDDLYKVFHNWNCFLTSHNIIKKGEENE